MNIFGFFKRKLKEPVNIWSVFDGKENTPKILDEKAALFATVLLDWLSTGIPNLMERIDNTSSQKADGKFGEVFFEMVVFCLFYVDRLAADILDREMRRHFSTALSRETVNFLAGGDANEKTRILFDVLYTSNFDEYRKYRFTNENEDGMKGTLFWEFEKKIVRILGFKEDVGAIMQVHALLITLLKQLQIPRLLRSEM